jgi:hypothetical protein
MYMKKLLLTAAAILATLNMYGQGTGTMSFTSVGAPDTKKITDPTGAFAGAGYQAALYWGSNLAETDDRNLTQIGAAANLLTGTSAGTFFGGGRTITTPGSTVNGPVLTFQVRAWQGGAGSSYDTAQARGKGPMFQYKTKDPTNPLETTPSLYQAPGYLGFQVVIPEPSVIGLGLLGAGTLLMLRRRK